MIYAANLGKIFLTVAIALGLISCADDKRVRNYPKFVESEKYAESYAVYENEELMEKANKNNTSIEINLKKQRLKLLVKGEVALDSPTTTGSKKKKDINDGEVRDKRTPRGTFRILEKKEHKQSTIFGKIYKGEEEVYYGDRRKYKKKYDRFEGVEMPYWMRVKGPVGIHESEVIVRNTGSNGCIRLPAETAVKVYSKVKEGTKVKIK